MEKTKGNGHKLLLGRSQLDMREIFPLRTLSHWNNLAREVVDFPTLDTFKIWKDRALGHRVCRTVLLPRKISPDNP